MTSVVTDAATGAIPAESVAWIERSVPGSIVSVRRFPRARDAWWVETTRPDGDRDRWLLKGRRAPARVVARSQMLTDFGPAREAAAMTALAGTGIRVPRLGGFDAASAQLLIERIDGSALIHRAPEAERRDAVADYARQLAALHALDWRELDVGRAIPVPLTAREMSTGGWLRGAEADAATAGPRLRYPEPLLRLLVRWLHDSVPRGRDVPDIRLLHGDAGVTNFLSLDGRVTALVDWELAIFGDPMSDLGNARYREALYPSGTYAHLVRSYQDATGAPVDRAAVGYYTALAGTVLSLCTVATTHHPRAGQPEAVVRLWQDALARCVACEAVCEVEGIDPDYRESPSGAASGFEALADLSIDRADSVAPDGPTEHAYARLARVLRNALTSGAAIDDALRVETGELTGRSTATAVEARTVLDGLVESADREMRNGILLVLARDARRRLEVLSPLRDAEVWEDVALDGGTAAVELDGGTAALPSAVLPPLPAENSS